MPPVSWSVSDYIRLYQTISDFKSPWYPHFTYHWSSYWVFCLAFYPAASRKDSGTWEVGGRLLGPELYHKVPMYRLCLVQLNNVLVGFHWTSHCNHLFRSRIPRNIQKLFFFGSLGEHSTVKMVHAEVGILRSPFLPNEVSKRQRPVLDTGWFKKRQWLKGSRPVAWWHGLVAFRWFRCGQMKQKVPIYGVFSKCLIRDVVVFLDDDPRWLSVKLRNHQWWSSYSLTGVKLHKPLYTESKLWLRYSRDTMGT